MTKDMMKLVEEASAKSVSKKRKRKPDTDDSQFQESTPKVPAYDAAVETRPQAQVLDR